MNKETYITHIKADTANGIQVVDFIDYPEADWVSFADFRESLPTLSDDEEVFCAVDPEQLEALKEEYGIN